MHRPRAGSVRLPLFDQSHLHSRSPSPDSKRIRVRRRRILPYGTIHRLRSIQPARIFRWALAATATLLALLWFIWEVHIEISFYSRSWIREEVKKLEPLAGCFDPNRLSSQYNFTHARAPKKHEVQAGLPLRMGMDCYDFAGTLQRYDTETYEHAYFHTYWRSDLVPFGERQAWMLKSFFATQDLSISSLVLWSNGDLSENPHIAPFLRLYPASFHLRIVDTQELAKGTALEGSRLLKSHDKLAWVDGDLIRLLVTWAYGGVWIDMDSLFTRDMAPLLNHEFVTQWDCYDKKYTPLNGALLHFQQHSPYLCEAFHIMARSPPPRSGSTDWGSTLYLKLWRRLVAEKIPPFKILPFCFSDARSCRLDNRLPDPFKPDPLTWGGGRSLVEGGPLDDVLGKVFSVHLHNQWDKNFPQGGWVDRLLLRRYEERLSPELRPEIP